MNIQDRRTSGAMPMPPYPTMPAPEDWYYAASAIHRPIPSAFGRSYVGGHILFLDRLDTRPREVWHADPLGRLVSAARERMRTRHRCTPKYTAFLADQDRLRRARDAEAQRALAARLAARTEKERAEEDAFYAAGGTAVEWAAYQEAKAQEKAEAKSKRATSRTRAKARSTPRKPKASA